MTARTQTLTVLRAHRLAQARHVGVRSLALWLRGPGPSRCAQRCEYLLTFDGPATSARYFGLQLYLEDLLGRPVDLVT